MHIDNPTRLRHMLEYSQQAVSFCAGTDFANFENDQKLMLALTRCIEIIGEAASQVTRDFQDEHPEIPWPQIIGMRNRLVHGYAFIDNELLWKTATVSLPELVFNLTPLI